MSIFQLFRKLGPSSFLCVFFTILYLTVEESYEDVLLLLAFYFLMKLIKKIKECKGIKDYARLAIIILIFYIITITIIFTQTYSYRMSIFDYKIVNEGKAVLIVYEGESEKYSFDKTLRNIKNNNSLLDYAISPFKMYSDKKQYRDIGKSRYKENTIKVRNRIQNLLTDEYKVYMSYLKDTNYVEETLIDIVNDGYHNIIIVPVFLTEGNNYNELNRRIEKMKLYNLNITIKYSEPLWNSDNLARTYANKLQSHIKEEDELDIGILLIGEEDIHGAQENSTELVKKNVMFREKIRAYILGNTEIPQERIVLSWYDTLEPDYNSEVKKLLEHGVGKIYCAYIDLNASDIDNNKIYNGLKNNIDFPEGVSMKIIDGFITEEVLILELKNRILFTNMQKWN